MKKLLLFLSVITLILLTGCGTSETKSQTITPNADKSVKQVTESQQPIEQKKTVEPEIKKITKQGGSLPKFAK